MINVDLGVDANRDFNRAKKGEYKGNPIKDIVDYCIKDDIGICAITSIGNGHSELTRSYINKLPQGYKVEDLGKGVRCFHVDNGNNDGNVYIIESHVDKAISHKGVSFDCLVVGGSENMKDSPIRIISSPAVGSWDKGVYGSLPSTVDRKYFQTFDAVEGHRASSPDWGNAHSYEFANALGISPISTSGAERIKQIGRGHFSVNREFLDFKNGNTLLRSLRWNIRSENGGAYLPNFKGTTLSLKDSLLGILGYN
ncbi:hypothetical protein HYT56_00210 [Candidatus Woesearchaeota archaeon]|nr:hypothetical protein [Candidatus Woesearchaeota archaeon]